MKASLFAKEWIDRTYNKEDTEEESVCQSTSSSESEPTTDSSAEED